MFAHRGWAPFSFQRAAWSAYARGQSGLVHAATGTGKTLAVWMGAINEAIALGPQPKKLRALWITPMRALAADTLKSLREATSATGLEWTIDLRTGDTSSAIKARQRTSAGTPHALVTTPESLSVMLSYADSSALLSDLRLVVVDEWHELLGTKRGVQTELGLAHLRSLTPTLRTWGLSATLGNLPHAMTALLGPRDAAEGVLVQGHESKDYRVETILPQSVDRFPWAGHIGLRLLKPVLAKIDSARSTLLFCNTRGQAEIWFQALMRARPEWIDHQGSIAIHHGSLDRALRNTVEDRLKAGTLRCVVCTSSLDLGVDFPPVDQVIQIGSAKGIARFMQRAGRSGHQPGRPSTLICVPTNAWELIEFAAARHAIAAKTIEPRAGLRLSLDVLCQHLLTIGIGPGFTPEAVLNDIRSTHAFADLTDEQFQWALDFAARGGASLHAYARYARLTERDGVYKAADQSVARLHRLGIGTITSDGAISVRFKNGTILGMVEEGFVGHMRPGDQFVFAGRKVQLLSIRNMIALVRPKAGAGKGPVARWAGGRMPLSHELAQRVRELLSRANADDLTDPEVITAKPILDLQRAWSRLPRPDELLIEQLDTAEGFHTFVYPLEGRLVHEGLATLLAFRLGRTSPNSFSISCSDLGFELLGTKPAVLTESEWREMLSLDRLTEDLLECLNASELAKRQFREIARVAGLLTPSLPGRPSSTKQAQASSELFFDVFAQFDPHNMLLDQAKREVLQRQLQVERLGTALRAIRDGQVVVTTPPQLTPLAFPLWADRLREQLTTEQWEVRVQRMAARLEGEADKSRGSSSPITRATRPKRRAKPR